MEDIMKSCPLTQEEIIDQYFMTCRSKILDIAAFLDRMNRASRINGQEDFRYKAFKKSLLALSENKQNRVETIQMLLSDQDTTLLDHRDQQNAQGASKTKRE